MKDWRVAKSLIVLRDQINDRWPKRNNKSDGTIGDASHSSRESDHNPNEHGVVCAMDVTNDPAHECHAALIVEAIRASRDHRVQYIIFNYFICRSYAKSAISTWTWAPYNGPNPHGHHFHISVKEIAADDVAPWVIE